MGTCFDKVSARDKWLGALKLNGDREVHLLKLQRRVARDQLS